MSLQAPRIGWLHVFQLVLCAFVSLLAAAVYFWRDDIFERLVDPAVPYLLYKPPPAPDYSRARDWAVLPPHPEAATLKDPQADVFFIHPTTFDAGRWNDAVDDKLSGDYLERVMIPNYAGPFAKAGRVFAPRYRQSNLYSMLTLREDARDARRLGYDDVKAAFDFYMSHYNAGRPVIIAGVEQGGTLAERLANEAMAATPERLKQLAAVYVIEAPAAPDRHGPTDPVPACTTRYQARCLVSYLTEELGRERATRRMLRRLAVWDGDQLAELAPRKPLCVNPLVGAVTTAAAPRKANLGAANASRLEWGVEPGFLSDQVSAQCDDGLLQVSRPKSPSLRRGRSWAERNRVQAYNLFYADLEADAKARVAAVFGHTSALAPPITQVIEIKPSHVRRPG